MFSIYYAIFLNHKTVVRNLPQIATEHGWPILSKLLPRDVPAVLKSDVIQKEIEYWGVLLICLLRARVYEQLK